ncbi:MAG: methyltransferase domain-containing protein [Terriglobia bacterium]
MLTSRQPLSELALRYHPQRRLPALCRLPALLPLLLLTLLLPAGLASQQSTAKRDAWQRPQEVLDALGIQAGSVVADIGSGRGYFTFHLARRVGASGRVYAVDIDEKTLAIVRQRAERARLNRVETLLGARDDPRLPPETLDAALIVNAYHEMHHYDAMLQGVYRALKPGGRLGIIDGAIAPGQKRTTYYRRHRIPAALVREDAARNGFRFLRTEPGFVRPRDNRKFYFLIFEKPKP